MYQTKRLNFEETTLSFDIVLFSIWFVERDKEVVFHSKNVIGKEPETLYSLLGTPIG